MSHYLLLIEILFSNFTLPSDQVIHFVDKQCYCVIIRKIRKSYAVEGIHAKTTSKQVLNYN